MTGVIHNKLLCVQIGAMPAPKPQKSCCKDSDSASHGEGNIMLVSNFSGKTQKGQQKEKFLNIDMLFTAQPDTYLKFRMAKTFGEKLTMLNVIY